MFVKAGLFEGEPRDGDRVEMRGWWGRIYRSNINLYMYVGRYVS
jgi:hypothetical protein